MSVPFPPVARNLSEFSEPGTRKGQCEVVTWYSLASESATISRRWDVRVWRRVSWGAREASHRELEEKPLRRPSNAHLLWFSLRRGPWAWMPIHRPGSWDGRMVTAFLLHGWGNQVLPGCPDCLPRPDVGANTWPSAIWGLTPVPKKAGTQGGLWVTPICEPSTAWSGPT